MNSLPPPLLYALGYLFVLIAALILVSVVLNRLTREERRAARTRRTRARDSRAGKTRGR